MTSANNMTTKFVDIDQSDIEFKNFSLNILIFTAFRSSFSYKICLNIYIITTATALIISYLALVTLMSTYPCHCSCFWEYFLTYLAMWEKHENCNKKFTLGCFYGEIFKYTFIKSKLEIVLCLKANCKTMHSCIKYYVCVLLYIKLLCTKLYYTFDPEYKVQSPLPSA